MGLLLQYNLINLQVFNLNKFSNHKLDDNIRFYSWKFVVVFDLGWQSSGVQTEPEEVTPRWLVLSPAALLRVRVSRVRVRDEPLGEDDESGQLRDITIRLGSTPSLRSLSDFTWQTVPYLTRSCFLATADYLLCVYCSPLHALWTPPAEPTIDLSETGTKINVSNCSEVKVKDWLLNYVKG